MAQCGGDRDIDSLVLARQIGRQFAQLKEHDETLVNRNAFDVAGNAFGANDVLGRVDHDDGAAPCVIELLSANRIEELCDTHEAARETEPLIDATATSIGDARDHVNQQPTGDDAQCRLPDSPSEAESAAQYRAQQQIHTLCRPQRCLDEASQ